MIPNYHPPERIRLPFNTADDGLAYTVTTRYGAMCESNLKDGNFPMTGILEIINPTNELRQMIEDGTIDFDKGLPKDKKCLGMSVHPLSRAMEFGDGKIKSLSPALRSTDFKSPHCVWESEPTTCAIRGRGTQEEYRQELEVGENVANAITTVSKDSMVLEPSILCLMPWNRPGGDVGDISPSITTSAWQHNNFVKEPTEDEPMVMADPRKSFGMVRPHKEASPTLLSTDYKSPHLVMEQQNNPTEKNEDGIEYKGRVIKEGDGLYTEDSQDFFRGGLAGVSRTLKSATHDAATCVKNEDGANVRYRIRKLTPRECYRLMDVPEHQIDRLIASGISKSQHYKLAGNSIVVSCLYHIFKSLFTQEIPENQQLTLF